MPRLAELLKPPTNADGTPKVWSRSEPLSVLQPQPGMNLPAEPFPEHLKPVVNIRCPLPQVGTTPAGANTSRQYFGTAGVKFPIFGS
jgi:hypothetical protein